MRFRQFISHLRSGLIYVDARMHSQRNSYNITVVRVDASESPIFEGIRHFTVQKESSDSLSNRNFTVAHEIPVWLKEIRSFLL